MEELLKNRQEIVGKERPTYTREEVFQACVEYFGGDELSANVWINKYALKDSYGNLYEKTPKMMHDRLSSELHRIEQKYDNPMSLEQIQNLLYDFKYIIPQGSPMSGIGNNFQTVSLSNCFVIGSENPSDSYGGIMKIDQEQVQLMKRRGGVGHDLSGIRPKKSPVKNSALTSTGVVPFMERYSNSTREVAQDGRRGALMLSISTKHPDSEEFIDAKMDGTKVTGANVSIKAHDDFMKSVLGDGKYIQQYPIDSDSPQVIKEVDSKRIWNKVIHNAWKSAEPGVLFWDRVIEESLPDRYADLGYKTVSTNPCVTSDSWVMTNEGPRQVSDLIGVDFTALVDNGSYLSKNGFFYTGDKKVYEIETNGGLKIKATDNHKFKTVVKKIRGKKEYKWVELKDLNIGDDLNLNRNLNQNFASQYGSHHLNDKIGWLIGSLVGDGSLVNETAHLRYWGENRSIMKKIAVDLIKTSLNYNDKLGSGEDNNEIITIKSNPLGKIANDLGLFDGKNLGYNIEAQSSEFYCGFISGILDADGTVLDNIKKGINVRLASSNLNNLEVIQRMLLRLGIVSTIAKNRRLEGKKLLPDGNGGLKEYSVKAQHELIISKENLLIFNERIGFKDNNKQEKLNNALSKLNRGLYKEYFIDKIKSITLVGIEDVYDCTVDVVHEFDCNGISVHNCGEIPLCPDDSCRLLAVNLYSYVDNPFTKKASFNFELFKEHAQYALRMMDDIIDLEIEKIDRIIEKIKSDPEDDETKRVELNLWRRIQTKCEEGRRTGVGITAEGDMLAAMGLTYGTKKATKFATEVHRIYAIEVYRSSNTLAKERGVFKVWDASREQNHPMWERLKEYDEDLYKSLMKYGRRNISCLTIAPTGSVSLMTQTTSGIEPAFMVAYKRRRKVNPNDRDVRIDFTDEVGDTWEEYNVYHHGFKKWIEITGHQYLNEKEIRLGLENLPDKTVDMLIEKSPYYKAMANDVDWVEKVKMQGAIQKWIDHSISVTVNLPEHVDEQLVNDVYVTAWKHGCKGCTIYRDGSRSGVLISKNEKAKAALFEENNAPKRPEVLSCSVMTFMNKGEKWVGFIGELDGRPYEIFTGALDNFPIPKWVEEGRIVKSKKVGEDGVKHSNYDFVYSDKKGRDIRIPDLNHAFDRQYYDYAKIFSGILRHGMPLPYLVDLIDTLNLDGDLITTWKAGVKRMLKKYINDGTTVSGKTCQECGSESLEYIEGCLSCKNCGNSKCGN